MATPKSPPSHVTHNRLTYPEEATDRFLAHLKIAGVPHARVIEVAAGTGGFTEILAARVEGFEIKAVESQLGMRERLIDRELSDVSVLDGSPVRVPLPDEWGEACVVAGAFHW